MSRTIKHLISELPDDHTFYSFEFFPPKTQSGLDNLTARLERMSRLGPLFVTITWGAGGSTASKSLEIAELCSRDLGLTTCLHLTCTNMDQAVLDDALEQAKNAGIRNILALRGDPPRGEEYHWVNNDSQFQHAVDLVRYIKEKYGEWFCVGVAAYPEGHVESEADSENQSPEKDLPYLVEKVKAGADFIITQLFFDADKYIEFDKLLKSQPELAEIPVVPGLMPVNTYQTFLRTARLAHATIPKEIHQKLENMDTDDDDKVKALGVELLSSIIHKLRAAKVCRGFHFYTLNLEKAVAKVLEYSGIVSEEAAAVQQTHGIPKTEALQVSAGKGLLGREATWDDFTNGRFGNSRSPAYGEIDGYGPTLHVDNKRALELWGSPKTVKDITDMFIRHITNELTIIPWNDQQLSAETALIQEELIEMNEKGLWTVASQPAGNCVRSDDKIYGWGGKGGRVFQKAFVEFFVPHNVWLKLKPKLDEDPDVTYYEGHMENGRGVFYSSLRDDKSANAVTWGVFPNKEIVQTTIIEEESFTSWRDESFSIWQQWKHLYPPKSPSAELIQQIYDTYHLVSVIHHDFFNETGLWQLILKNI
ncbi:hypothetical protein TRVA0_041S01288 [Trichomonascus vanleenenianus]|uniref:methylenetetrahydrofolate reductase (NAD(P)H) MET12 n=1 Tax=Trichomonascus vanleenenianus TaxID=2268995 RepID=UPI003ECAAC88